ncbi:MAG: recX [Gammaproteobacteria bacterium]|nr:recX [Gammaproteobacteria bacterium]
MLLKKSKTDWQDRKAVRRAAMDLLARREHSRFELYQKLGKKGSPSSLINQILDELTSESLLSDERFVESYINHRSGQGYGPIRIRQELLARGIDNCLIDECLDDNAVNWFELAAKVRIKKFGGDQPHDLVEQAKQFRFLQYRGFSFEQATCQEDI